jgi:homoserine O-succinyltransferase/O-acetyltransferase
MLARIRIASGNSGFHGDGPLVIGLVNNMPDGALESTERRFRELLSIASNGCAVKLRFFSLPGLPRSEAGRSHIERHYEDIDELWSTRLDGLIVTGTEPHALALPHEPYWPTLARLIDWAEEHTISTIWSCLAAHAAVLRRDGICRRSLREKLSGVFECSKVGEHSIIAGTPSTWRVPHSRYHDLPEDALASKGYQILLKSPEAGADLFVKQSKYLSIFVQGHPEYEPEALLREYRRDIRRFLTGEKDEYPPMPRGYFDARTAEAFAELRRRALGNRAPNLLADFPTLESEIGLQDSWLEPAQRLYANWLSYLVEHQRSKYSRKKNLASASRAARLSRLPSIG